MRDREVHWKEKQENEWDDVLLPDSEPEMGLFTDDERAIIDRVFDEMRPLNATASRDLSHEKSAGWRVLENGQTIPYESAFISTAPAPPEAVEMGRKLAEYYGRKRSIA